MSLSLEGADATKLRFRVGSRVECRVGRSWKTGTAIWETGTVSKHFYVQDDFEPGMCAPYQVKLDGNFFTENAGYTKYIYAHRDSDDFIRASSVSRSAALKSYAMLPPGCALGTRGTVRLQGLMNATELNNRTGTLKKYVPDSDRGRWCVRLHETDKTVRVRPSNLCALYKAQRLPDTFSYMNAYPRNDMVEDDVSAGYSWLDEGNFDEAAKIADEALGQFACCFQAIGLQADIAWKRPPANFPKAIRLVDEAIRVAEIVQPAWTESTELHWGWMDNRPYMRLLHQKALIHAAAGDYASALVVAKHLLRTNPDDNQGIRTLAVNWMVQTHDWAGLDKLLSKYVEGTVMSSLTYALALRGFVLAREGRISNKERDQNLRKAMLSNPMVPQCLLDGVPTPETPQYMSLGGTEEAELYAMHNASMWSSVNGALDWLDSSRGSAKPTETELVRALDNSKFIIIKFRKANGDIRDIVGTRKLKEVPLRQRPKSGYVQAHVPGAAIHVFEYQGEWRSLKYENVIEVPFFRILTQQPSAAIAAADAFSSRRKKKKKRRKKKE